MDPDYNSTDAKIALEKAYIQSKNDVKDSIAPTSFETSNYRIVFVEQPRSWRIISQNDVYDCEEQIFHLHGIVCNSDLPPLQIKLSDTAKSKAKYLRQAIQITGLGTVPFDTDMSAIESIHAMMKSHLESETIETRPWQPSFYEGYKALDAAARYFTQRKFVPMEAGLPFETGVDSNGVLAQLRGGDLIHAMDNKVDYLREQDSGDNTDSNVKRIEPKDILIGDVVRLTMSFVGYMNKDKSVSMTALMRGITVITPLGKPSSNTRNCTNLTVIPRVISIKRKRVYDEEYNARRKLERMDLGGGAS